MDRMVVPGSINSHYFPYNRDKLINPIVGVYIPIIRIPIKGGMTIPNIATLDHGTSEKTECSIFFSSDDICFNTNMVATFLVRVPNKWEYNQNITETLQ